MVHVYIFNILSWWKPKSLSYASKQTELRVSELKDWESQVGDKKETGEG